MPFSLSFAILVIISEYLAIKKDNENEKRRDKII